MPERIAALPTNHAGYPVPWFVAWVDGKPDFRLMDEEKIHRAIIDHLCWICGEALGRFQTYCVGPMCAVNRISAEPPSHTECAVYAAQVCPFILNPSKERREGRMPEDAKEAAGIMLRRNPGVILLWTTRTDPMPFRAPGGLLFTLPDPESVRWFAEGRAATRAEILASIDSGLPALLELDGDDPRAKAEVDRRYEEVKRTLIPA
jgi:hypothetical protein